MVHDYAIPDGRALRPLPMSPIAFDLDNIVAARLRAGPRAGVLGPLLLRRDAARRAQVGEPHGRRDGQSRPRRLCLCVSTWARAGSMNGKLIAHVLLFERYGSLGNAMGFDVRSQAFDPIPWSRGNGGPTLRRVVAGSSARGRAPRDDAAVRSEARHADVPPAARRHPNRAVFGTAGVAANDG